MKKTLLLATFFSGCFFMNAQMLESDNYEGLMVGNIGTDLTGMTAGQGGYYTFSVAPITTATNADFQIINDVTSQGKVFQINGPANATESKVVWKTDLITTWGTRTSGYDIIEVEYDFFTGAATTSKSTTGFRLYNAAGQTVAGFRFVPETKVITGLARYNNNGTVGTYFFNLGAAGAALPLTASTWYRIGFAFNKTTGEVTWKGPGFYGTVIGTEIGVNPDEVDFVVAAGTGNTVSAVSKFDNYTAKATAVEALLGVEEVLALSANVIKLYPNPVNDVLSINASNISITNLEIMDINGRVIKSILTDNSFEATINVSNLSAGVYMINIYTENNKTTKKFVKN
jgi:hypothetical protein